MTDTTTNGLTVIVYIGTTNDTSGNPRRGWIIGYGSRDAYFVDEGYAGRSGAAHETGLTPIAFDVPMITVTPKQYRTWKYRTKADIALRDAITAKLGSQS